MNSQCWILKVYIFGKERESKTHLLVQTSFGISGHGSQEADGFPTLTLLRLVALERVTLPIASFRNHRTLLRPIYLPLPIAPFPETSGRSSASCNDFPLPLRRPLSYTPSSDCQQILSSSHFIVFLPLVNCVHVLSINVN
jgi:hypothetical protein